MTKNLQTRLFSILIILPVVFTIIFDGKIIFNLFLISCFVLAVIEWINLVKKITYKYFGILFLIISFLSAYKIRNYFEDNTLNQYFFFYILIVCIFTDIGGFFFGKLIKGPKLTKISPNKTISGSVGALVLSIFAAFLFSNLIDISNLPVLLNIYFYSITIILSIVSQLGDLSISFFKRKYKVKDTGNLIPGHGGILDRIDGMLFVFPITFLIVLNIS